MYLARKVSLAKWLDRCDRPSGLVTADAVTADLRTSGNTLSFWRCDNAETSSVEEIALVLAAEANRIDKVDVALVLEKEIRDAGHKLCDTPKGSRVEELVHKHVDVCELDFSSLMNIAVQVRRAASSSRLKRVKRRRVRDLLLEAVVCEKLDLSQLEDDVRSELESHLASLNSK